MLKLKHVVKISVNFVFYTNIVNKLKHSSFYARITVPPIKILLFSSFLYRLRIIAARMNPFGVCLSVRLFVWLSVRCTQFRGRGTRRFVSVEFYHFTYITY